MVVFGYEIICCKEMADHVQARKHKKKRINKKWRKRYGMKEVPWNKIFVTNDRKMYAHPTMVAKIEEAFHAKYRG
jgi:hypothetical protein